MHRLFWTGFVLSGLVFGAAVAAHADSATTFYATTYVGSNALPEPVATGRWSLGTNGTKAALSVTVVNPSPATTHLEATWRSPFVTLRKRCFGDYVFDYRNHRLLQPTPHVVDLVRYRMQGARWGPWVTELAEDYQDSSPDLAVGERVSDDCVFPLRVVPSHPLQFEIRHVVDYSGTHRVDETLTVTVP